MKNLPAEFKGFYKSFETLTRRYGYYTIFEDFLDLFINGFSFDYKIDLEQIQSKYSKEERLLFGSLIQEVILTLNQKIKSDTDWYDFFGTFYELVSLSKQKGFAQFFTPPTVCTFMAQILDLSNSETFSDPCSGSARFSLAANSVCLGNFHFLVDLDYTCAKMSALNLMLHGINGIVVCDNSLDPGSEFRGAFVVNHNLNKTGVPQIEFIDHKDLAYKYVSYRLPKTKTTPTAEKIETNDLQQVKSYLDDKTKQYSMF